MNQKVVPLIVGLLLVVAFLGGRVATQKTTGSQPAKQPSAATPGAEQAAVLGASDQEALVKGATLTKGNPEAPVTIVEFSDYQCPYCARYATTTLKQILEAYGDKVYYVWHDYPLGFHPNAIPAALAARCAGEQGKYWEMHDQLFLTQGTWSEQEDPQGTFTQQAKDLGLDAEKLTQCLEQEQGKGQIETDLKLGRDVGIRATPTFFINGQKLEGAQPFEEFQAIIDQALNQ
jgi:protein-disulfide isomerase